MVSLPLPGPPVSATSAGRRVRLLPSAATDDATGAWPPTMPCSVRLHVDLYLPVVVFDACHNAPGSAQHSIPPQPPPARPQAAATATATAVSAQNNAMSMPSVSARMWLSLSLFKTPAATTSQPHADCRVAHRSEKATNNLI